MSKIHEIPKNFIVHKKNIRELTEDEAKEIIEFVHPGRDCFFRGLSFDRVLDEEGHENITMSGHSIIGIQYHNGQDGCLLLFNNVKVISWLYEHNYEIKDLLEKNHYIDNLEKNYDLMGFSVHMLSKGTDAFADDAKDRFTLEYVIKKCKEIVDNYYFVD